MDIKSLKSSRKPLGAILALVAATIAITAMVFVAMSSADTSLNGGCPVLTTPPSPKASPVAGWEYLLIYNHINGSLNAVNVRSACEWEYGLAQHGLSNSANATAIARTIMGLRPPLSYLDITNNPYLPKIMTNGYANAFYVSLQTGQLTLKLGVTFSSDYQVAYYNGHAVTNGTRIPTL